MVNNAEYFTKEDLYQLQLSLTMTEGAGEETHKMLRLIRSLESQTPDGCQVKLKGILSRH